MPDQAPTSDELQQTVAAVAAALSAGAAEYALIGGLAASIRGSARTTWDVDLLVNVSQRKLAPLLESLRREPFDLDVTGAIRSWNQDHLLEFWRGPVRVDWIKATLPLFQRILNRATPETIDGRKTQVADAEGMLVLKLIAMRPQDQQDIQAILSANRGRLDLDWVRREWWAVIDENDPAKEHFERLVHEYYEG